MVSVCSSRVAMSGGLAGLMSADIEDFMEKGACASGYGDDEGDCNEATYIHTGIAASP